MITGLIDATLHQRQAQIAYFSFNSRRTKSYTVDPYRLVYYRGGLYLYARAHEYGEVRTFAVERIQRIEVLDQGFEIPADFSPSEYARAAFGIFGGKAQTVELRLRARDGRLHPRAQLAREPGARGRARRRRAADHGGRARASS